METAYTILDVFTQKRMHGNPLAVVHDADYILDTQMQEIASEFNLSETIFVCKPKNERYAASVRIFTPAKELPFAGHPTVGLAVLLGLKKKLSAVRLEEKIGTIVAITNPTGKHSGHARFSLPELPKRIASAPDNAALAEALGLGEGDIGVADMQPAIYSAGVPFVLVPVRDASTLSSIRLERRGWQSTFHGPSDSVYAFTVSKNGSDAQILSRSFVNLGDIKEDPATGSAAAALCGLLAEHLYTDEGLTDFVIKQGEDMGRPSFIEAQVKRENGTLTHVGIGGNAVVLAEGVLHLDD